MGRSVVHPHRCESMSRGLSSHWSRWSEQLILPGGGREQFQPPSPNTLPVGSLPELRDQLERRASGKMWDEGQWVQADGQ